MRTIIIRFLLVFGLAPVFWQLGYSGGDNDEAGWSGWEHRLIAFVLSNEADRVAVEEMVKGYANEIAERDILFVNLGEIDIESDYSVSIGAKEKELWRTFWGLGTDESRFVLVGKDGGVKATQRDLLRMNLFFELIDEMPMRRAEMREQTASVKRS